ncbi:MAG: hypothetical protein KJ737_14895 [Proteobacteria bacterium]|nr:hypothetical protein [Pseudomonadota bacterium]
MQKKVLYTIVAVFWGVLFIISGHTAAETSEKGHTMIQAGIEQKNTDIKNELTDLLELENQSDWQFLSKLSDSEQIRLSERIAYVLDEEGGIIVSLLVTGTKMLPNFILVRTARMLEPETVAKLSNKMPVKAAVQITKGLDREFLMEVTKKLKPQKGIAIIESCPLELVTDVSKRLLANNDDIVLARLADYMSPDKLGEISENLTPEENVRISNQMKNRSVIAKILVSFPDDYLIKLIKECFRREYYSLVADVTEEMEKGRLLGILGQMDQDDLPKSIFLAEVSVYLDPIKSTSIIEDLPDELLIDVNRHLILKDEYSVMARLADQLSPEKLLTLSREMLPRQNVLVANQMKNRLLIAKLLSSFEDDYIAEMTIECFKLGYVELVLGVMGEVDPNRRVKIMDTIEAQDGVSPEFLKLIK